MQIEVAVRLEALLDGVEGGGKGLLVLGRGGLQVPAHLEHVR